MQCCSSVPLFPTETSLAATTDHEILCLEYAPPYSDCDYEPRAITTSDYDPQVILTSDYDHQVILTSDYEGQAIMTSQQCGSSGEESCDETLVHGLTLRKSPIFDFTEDEAEKLFIRQQKAAKRKEKNKEAARKSNLAKKMFRDNLQKRSTELLEQKLQLEQDIRDLRSQLNNYMLLYHQMTHVCTLPQPSQPPFWQL